MQPTYGFSSADAKAPWFPRTRIRPKSLPSSQRTVSAVGRAGSLDSADRWVKALVGHRCSSFASIEGSVSERPCRNGNGTRCTFSAVGHAKNVGARLLCL